MCTHARIARGGWAYVGLWGWRGAAGRGVDWRCIAPRARPDRGPRPGSAASAALEEEKETPTAKLAGCELRRGSIGPLGGFAWGGSSTSEFVLNAPARPETRNTYNNRYNTHLRLSATTI